MARHGVQRVTQSDRFGVGAGRIVCVLALFIIVYRGRLGGQRQRLVDEEIPLEAVHACVGVDGPFAQRIAVTVAQSSS